MPKLGMTQIAAIAVATVLGAYAVSSSFATKSLAAEQLVEIQYADAAAVDYFLKIDGIEGESANALMGMPATVNIEKARMANTAREAALRLLELLAVLWLPSTVFYINRYYLNLCLKKYLFVDTNATVNLHRHQKLAPSCRGGAQASTDSSHFSRRIGDILINIEHNP